MKSTRCLLMMGLIYLLPCVKASAQVLLPTDNRQATTQLLNGTWKFKYIPSVSIGADSLFYQSNFDVAKWSPIKVPGHWELQGFATPMYGKQLKEGTGLYRRDFTIPASWKGKPLYIAFDGVQFGYTFWVNGKFGGEFAGSYNLQMFDISGLVKAGASNALSVRVSTRPKGWEFDTNDDWAMGGIVRDVTLFSLEPSHFKNLTVQTLLKGKQADINIKGLIEQAPNNALTVAGTLFDPQGKAIKTFHLSNAPKEFNRQLQLEKPLLWTAETPYLYKLHLKLMQGSRLLQAYTQRVGIRQVDWSGGIFKINNQPVKLRGVDHHDLSPINGRAIAANELAKDLRMIRQANINFIRTSHYPPNSRMLDMCDSLGIYVMVEVPFGYGDEHLNDESYLPLLLQRANSTVWRDKNHPSVIIWSVGNENPITKMTMRTAQHVKELDPTRPVCFPQTQGPFDETVKKYPDSVDVYSPHYPTVPRMNVYANQFNKPIIFTEYAHSLGLDFDLLESLTDVIWKSPKLAGGAIWMLFDQGILRKSPAKISRDEETLHVWKDSVNYYDMHGIDGTDGIVYANRIPQVDYWEVRKVYSPVQAMDDTLHYQSGPQQVKLKLINRYDFTNLTAVKCKWELLGGTQVLSSGNCLLKGMPHDTASIPLTFTLPAKQNGQFYSLKLTFKDKSGYQFYEKTYPIVSKPEPIIIADIKASPQVSGSAVNSPAYHFELSPSSGLLTLKNATGQPLITEGPYARVNRKPTMSSIANDKRLPKGSFWSPFVLTRPEAKMENPVGKSFTVDYHYQPDSAKGQAINGKVIYHFTDDGAIEINYHLTPQGTGKAVEAGLSLWLPKTLTEFRWIGKGPYAGYPGKSRLDEFGCYHLNTNDLYFSGNRQDVQLAILSDGKGNGFVLIPNNANISVERSPQGIILSHNVVVSGRFNKFGVPETLYDFQQIKELSGRFTLIPFSGKWPAAIEKYFGKTDGKAIPFQPFYNSYDQ